MDTVSANISSTYRCASEFVSNVCTFWCGTSANLQRGFEASWLSLTFSKAIFLGNGLVAILSGLLANYLVDDMKMGPVAPFDAALVLLAIGGAVVQSTWSENYGDSSDSSTVMQQFQRGYSAITSGIVPQHKNLYHKLLPRDVHALEDALHFASAIHGQTRSFPRPVQLLNLKIG